MSKCVACNETLSPDALWWEFNCAHVFCLACMISLLRSSLTKGPFPPKCCGEPTAFYEIETVRSVLPEDLCAKLDEKLEEFNAEDRTYCSVATCSTFIKSAHISGNDATCPVCGTVTCVACKAATHTGECPEGAADPAMQMLLQTAEDEGWRRCRRCRSMIERIEGCNHMLCTCGYEFCYQCGEYECDCVSDEEEERLTRCQNCGMRFDACGCQI